MTHPSRHEETNMTNYYRQLKIGDYPGDPNARRLIASGVWLRVAFIGAAAFVGALIALFAGEAELLPALAFVTWGAVAAFIGWRRSRSLLSAPSTSPVAVATIREANVARLGASALR